MASCLASVSQRNLDIWNRCMCMWSNLPLDLLIKILCFLSPESLARARSVCKNWQKCSKAYPISTTYSSWFLALPIRSHRPYCYAHNPVLDKWHQLSLQLPSIRPVGSIGNLLLLRLTNSTTLQLALCNPFTTHFMHLPTLHVPRTNPAVGLVTTSYSSNHVRFRVYVVGGISETAHGGATYETQIEMYDSETGTWQIVGSMPVKFAVRLTVWTPNENVWVGGTLYWVTSARAYSVVGFDVGRNRWRELSVPMAERLEFATLVPRNGTLGLVGGTCGGTSACIWELIEGDKWCPVDKVPPQLWLRFVVVMGRKSVVKCVGNEDVICFYRDVGYGHGMLVSNKVGEMGTWEWTWIHASPYINGKQLPNSPIRGALVHPTLVT